MALYAADEHRESTARKVAGTALSVVSFPVFSKKFEAEMKPAQNAVFFGKDADFGAPFFLFISGRFVELSRGWVKTDREISVFFCLETAEGSREK